MRWWGKLIVVVIAAAVGYGFVANWWTMRDIKVKSRQTYSKAKNRINREAGILPDNSAKAGPAAICCQNLKGIESIKRKVAEEQNRIVGTITWNEVAARMPGGAIPTCPAGGEYHLNPLGQVPTCSIGSNRTRDRSDDHIISGF